MDHVHHCLFCGFRRAAASAAIVRPHCEGCGSVLRSAARAEVEAQSTTAFVGAPGGGKLARAGRRAALLGVFGAVAYLSLRLGYTAGGIWLAMTAVALTVFAFLPLVPKGV